MQLDANVLCVVHIVCVVFAPPHSGKQSPIEVFGDKSGTTLHTQEHCYYNAAAT
jgi:hypothetical protein